MLKLSTAESIKEIASEQWNELAGTNIPFLRHAFLNALEESCAVSAETGWRPRHLKVEQSGEIIALMPLYLKEHSQGEYVFDHGWANAYHRNGLNYYPKWLTAIPFTPCQSKRILIKEGIEKKAVYASILDFFQQQSANNRSATWHCLFAEPEEQKLLKELGLQIREDVQFKWFNRNYRDFDDYLDQFSARKRKNIKRERRRVLDQKIELIKLTGTEVSEYQWQVFFNFYLMTYKKHGMNAYLNLPFFQQLAESMGNQLLLTLAVKENHYVGAALSLVGAETLYGRYWGCYKEYSSLHFETCYYQGIEYCIKNKLALFDSGAQGEHKISRGFEPVVTSSAHWIKDPRFATAIEEFTQAEKQHVALYKEKTSQFLPFKKK